MTNNSNNEMWFQEMDRTNPVDTTKSEERPEGSLNADTLAEGQVDNSLNTEVGSQSPEVANQSPEVANMFNLEGTSCSRGAEDQACQVQHHQDLGRELQHGGRA